MGHADVNLVVIFFGKQYTALDIAHEEGAGADIKNFLVANGAHHSAVWLAEGHENDDSDSDNDDN